MHRQRYSSSNMRSKADYTVFFVDHKSQEKNADIIGGGKLVKYESQSDVKVFVVKYASKASIKIMRQHFPR